MQDDLKRLEQLAAIIDEGCEPNRTSTTRVAREIKAIVKRLRSVAASQLGLFERASE